MKEVKKIALMAVGDEGWIGGIQYIINILNALNTTNNSESLEIYIFKHSTQIFNGLEKFNKIKLQVKEIDETLPPFNLLNRIKWFIQRKLFSRIYPRLENYLISEKFDYVFPALLNNHNGTLNSAAWIADFHYHHFPDGANKKVNTSAKNVISNIAYQGNKIILSSKFCEMDSIEIFPVTKGKTHVMPFAVFIDPDYLNNSILSKIIEKYSLPERYFMISNMFTPSKNHIIVFNAMGLLKKKGIEVNLVCTGNLVDYRNEGFTNEIILCITENNIRNQVYLFGIIPREDQMAMFRMSDCIIQPSLNEGWSTSVEEAKALGKNIILSNIGVHLEQYPDNLYFFNGNSIEELANRMEIVWKKLEKFEFPDLKNEKIAFEKYQNNVIEFGNKFLEIAKLE